MTTAKNVFDLAMKLAGENDERTGETETKDTQEFLVRVIDVMNVLRNELYPYSDTYAGSADGKRSVCPIITSMEQILDLDDVIAQSIMPYGLAAHLLLEDNPTMAGFFQQRYQELIYTIGTKKPSVWEDITPMYG